MVLLYDLYFGWLDLCLVVWVFISGKVQSLADFDGFKGRFVGQAECNVIQRNRRGIAHDRSDMVNHWPLVFYKSCIKVDIVT